jgi:hypothetical protein
MCELMTEFLVKSTKAQDFGPADFDIQWSIPGAPEAERLIEYWETASKYVVHFGGLRVPDDLETLKPFQVDNVFFKAVALDVLVVFAAFLRALRPQASTWKDGARIPDQDREPDQWRARLLADRFGRLRKSFLDACQQVELDASQLLDEASD